MAQAREPRSLRDDDDGHEHADGDDRHDPRVAGAERQCRTGVADELEPDDVPDERPRLAVGEDVEGDELGQLVAGVGEDRDDDEEDEEPPPARGGRVGGRGFVLHGSWCCGEWRRTRHRRPHGASTWRGWASVAGLLLLACHAQGRTRTGLKSKFADRVAAVLADAVRAGLELLEGVLGLGRPARALAATEISWARSAVLAPASAWSSPAPSPEARSRSSSSSLGELELDAVLLDLLEEDRRAPR